MPVLARLGDGQLRLAPHAAFDRRDAVEHLLPAVVAFIGRGIDTLHRGRLGAVALETFLHRQADFAERRARARGFDRVRSEEHTSELQSLMRISYAVFCLKKKKAKKQRKIVSI